MNPAATAIISPRDLQQRLTAFAHDSMMGRESGSQGDYEAAEYVAREFRQIGLRPAGDAGTYFQVVPFLLAVPDPTSRIEVDSARLALPHDFLPVSVAAAPRILDGVQAVYGGSLANPDRWISAEAARGKLVVVDVPPGFGGRGAGRVAADPRLAGATAVALVALEGLGSEIVARIVEGRPVTDTSRNQRAVPLLFVTRHAAATLLGSAADYPAMPAPGTPGRTLRGRFDVMRRPTSWPARNVIAILPGSDPALRGEYVSLTAHNDHVGFDHAPVDHDSLRAFNRVVRPMGADSPPRPPTAAEWTRIRTILDSLRRIHSPRPDSIRNGADDDGSGTISILAIARAMVTGGAHPRRSILFVSHTGEEAGLLGSAWFTDHPTVPIDSIVAEIDQDMVGRGTAEDLPAGGPTYLEVVGARRLSTEFGDLLEAANARQPVPFVFNYAYDAPNHPLQYYCRADHYNYARYGIPSVAFSRGEHLDYHQVTDEAQYIDYPDMARVSRMVYDAALLVANADHRPTLDRPRQVDPHAPCRQ